ncbi:hypothetical protein ABPG72_008369 [Tetrahymena utriculariae]
MKKIAFFVFFLYCSLQVDSKCQTNCLQCEIDIQTHSKTCLQCERGYILIHDLQLCVKECPTNYFLDTDSNLCLNCHHSCKSCSGNHQSQCIQCHENRELFRSKFPGEGFCYCQNEIYQPQCSMLEQQGFSKIFIISTFVILILAFILSVLKLNINYFIITVVFFQDISELSLINTRYPLQLQQLLSQLREIIFNFGSFIPQIIQNNVNDLNSQLVFYGNPKFALIRDYSSLFLLNIVNYFGLFIFFLALKNIKCFNNKKVKQLLLKNKNGKLMIFQLLQGNITLLFGLYEIVNFRLQLRNELFVEMINKLFLLTFFYTNIIWNSRLLNISQSNTILEVNTKNSQTQKYEIQEYRIQQSMIITQIFNSIIINMFFSNDNLQIFLFLFVSMCQLIVNLGHFTKKNFALSYYFYHQVAKVAIICMVFYLVNFSSFKKDHPSLLTSQNILYNLQIVIQIFPIIFTAVVLYFLIKKFIPKLKQNEIKVNQEALSNSKKVKIFDQNDPPISNKFSTRVSVKDRFLSTTFNMGSSIKPLSPPKLNNEDIDTKTKLWMDSKFEKTFKQINTQNSMNTFNVKNSLAVPLSDLNLRDSINL